MEQQAKIRAAYFLGICYMLMASTCVSSMRVCKPKKIINVIESLLRDLHKDLSKKDENLLDFKLKGPKKSAMEYKPCIKTFVNYFEKGIKEIPNHFPDDQEISKTTSRITNCVNKLRNMCEEIKNTKEEKCKNCTCDQGVVTFVDAFSDFTRELMKACDDYYIQKEDDLPTDMDTRRSIC